MKKTHWFRNTLIVLVICGLLGTILAAVLFNGENIRTYAMSTVQFSFQGSAEGKAPNGYSFDTNGFFSDEVLSTALETSGLADAYTVDQLRGNLTVTGKYPEGFVEQMTKYVSLLDADADDTAAITDYRATQYTVKLYNDFDRSISSEKLTELANQIMIAYREYFSKKYAASIETEDPISDLAEYDYAQQLDAISASIEQLTRYAGRLAEMAPDFRADKKGFGDIVVRYQGLTGDVDRLNATVTFNAVSKDRDRLQKRYEMEIRTQQHQLDSLTEELKLIEEQVKAYDKDGLIYVSANGTLTQLGNDEAGTYDKLVEKRKKITDQITETTAKIALYQGRLDDMTGVAEKNAQAGEEEEDLSAAEELTEREKKQLQDSVEQKIEALIAKKDAVTTDFTAMLEAYSAQEINERTVSITTTAYIAPSLLSGDFIVKMLKTAGPICAVGFMVCMILLIRSRRKEEA